MKIKEKNILAKEKTKETAFTIFIWKFHLLVVLLARLIIWLHKLPLEEETCCTKCCLYLLLNKLADIHRESSCPCMLFYRSSMSTQWQWLQGKDGKVWNTDSLSCQDWNVIVSGPAVTVVSYWVYSNKLFVHWEFYTLKCLHSLLSALCTVYNSFFCTCCIVYTF